MIEILRSPNSIGTDWCLYVPLPTLSKNVQSSHPLHHKQNLLAWKPHLWQIAPRLVDNLGSWQVYEQCSGPIWPSSTGARSPTKAKLIRSLSLKKVPIKRNKSVLKKQLFLTGTACRIRPNHSQLVCSSSLQESWLAFTRFSRARRRWPQFSTPNRLYCTAPPLCLVCTNCTIRTPWSISFWTKLHWTFR